MDQKGYMQANRDLWNEWTPIHERSELYDVAGFKAGRCTLRSVELEELGDVTGKSLLHLQCHFGMDMLSWARRGAKVTGVDFSEKAIELARSLASEIGIEAFECIRPAAGTGRPLRHRLHVGRRSLLAAGPSGMGAGHRTMPEAGGNVLHS